MHVYRFSFSSSFFGAGYPSAFNIGYVFCNVFLVSYRLCCRPTENKKLKSTLFLLEMLQLHA